MCRFFWIVLFLPFLSLAQGKLNLCFNGGFANYSGDLQKSRFTLSQSHAAFGAGLGYAIVPKLQVKLNLQYGKVSADDKRATVNLLKQRNLNFHSTIFESSLLFDYTILDPDVKKVSPYIFAGAALYHFNPYSFDSLGRKVYLQPLSTEGQGLAAYPDRKSYALWQISIPFGGGIRFKINERVCLGYEIGVRKLFNDYLDDVSTTYVDQNTLRNARGQQAVDLAFRGDELKQNPLTYPTAGATRGGEAFKDWYYFSGVTVSIGLAHSDAGIFGGRKRKGSVECPRKL
jgi:Domain of unknown function (DUF6089)